MLLRTHEILGTAVVLLCNEDKESLPQPVNVRILQSTHYTRAVLAVAVICASQQSPTMLSLPHGILLLTKAQPELFLLERIRLAQKQQTSWPLSYKTNGFWESLVFWYQNTVHGCYSLPMATGKHISLSTKTVLR